MNVSKGKFRGQSAPNTAFTDEAGNVTETHEHAGDFKVVSIMRVKQKAAAR